MTREPLLTTLPQELNLRQAELAKVVNDIGQGQGEGRDPGGLREQAIRL